MATNDRWTLEPNGDPYNIVTPEGEGLLLARFDGMTRDDFEIYAHAIVDALNEREQEHDA
jgi:hypothetical protein